jgi:putative flippase GtrA
VRAHDGCHPLRRGGKEAPTTFYLFSEDDDTHRREEKAAPIRADCAKLQAQGEGVARLKIAEDSRSETNGIKQKIISLDKKYGVFKLAKFGIASATGFLVSEVILTLGNLPLYGTASIPSAASSSPPFLALEIGALAFGVFIAFMINERFTFHVKPTREPGRWNGRVARLLRFEGVNAVGNAVVIVVQFALLATLSLSPLIGNVVGAIVSYPVTYLISLRFVWKG